jgi:prolyl-tRNA editing enzyme YbaK/EbsC (Cys-tRNA(Pro) deacylase)
MHRNVVRVVEAAAALDVTIEPREFAESTRTAAEAAAAIGVELGQIVKSLVFVVDDRPVLALVSGDRQLDEKRLSDVAGGGKVRRADADEVRAATGLPVGGVAPFGHDLDTYLDEGLLRYDVVWAAAGTPHVNFAIDPRLLLAATGARQAAITR